MRCSAVHYADPRGLNSSSRAKATGSSTDSSIILAPEHPLSYVASLTSNPRRHIHGRRWCARSTCSRYCTSLGRTAGIGRPPTQTPSPPRLPIIIVALQLRRASDAGRVSVQWHPFAYQGGVQYVPGQRPGDSLVYKDRSPSASLSAFLDPIIAFFSLAALRPHSLVPTSDFDYSSNNSLRSSNKPFSTPKHSSIIMRFSTIFAVVASALISTSVALPVAASSDPLSALGSVVGSTLGSITGNKDNGNGDGTNSGAIGSITGNSGNSAGNGNGITGNSGNSAGDGNSAGNNDGNGNSITL
nr:hypothetical protein CFP56_29865 [Quercus suber]